MFCPHCGVDSAEGQKFCKGCGTNLQIVSDALGRGEDTLGQLRIDIEGIKRNFAEALKGVKYGKVHRARYRGHSHDLWSKWVQYDKPGSTSPNASRTTGATTKELARDQGCGAMTQPGQPSSADSWEWLPYTRQHSMMRGLGSMFAGLATGGVLYFLGHQLIQAGTISNLELLAHIQGLTTFVSWIWIVGAIPVAKGLAQILYGLIFAESIKTMTNRLYTAAPQPQAAPPPAEIEPPAVSYPFAQNPPASVTENTTNILGGPRGVQNAQ